MRDTLAQPPNIPVHAQERRRRPRHSSARRSATRYRPRGASWPGGREARRSSAPRRPAAVATSRAPRTPAGGAPPRSWPRSSRRRLRASRRAATTTRARLGERPPPCRPRRPGRRAAGVAAGSVSPACRARAAFDCELTGRRIAARLVCRACSFITIPRNQDCHNTHPRVSTNSQIDHLPPPPHPSKWEVNLTRNTPTSRQQWPTTICGATRSRPRGSRSSRANGRRGISSSST
jgi:hypothetical protein